MNVYFGATGRVGANAAREHKRISGLLGGLDLILVGDPNAKLMPVGAAAMWAGKPDPAGHTAEGLRTWCDLNTCVELISFEKLCTPPNNWPTFQTNTVVS